MGSISITPATTRWSSTWSGPIAAQNFSNTGMGNADYGIELDDAPDDHHRRNLVVNNQTGGIALFYPQTANDLISNNEIILNDGDGILFCSCGDGGSAIYGNLIGTDCVGHGQSGQQGLRHRHRQPRTITVGGMAAGDANVIAFNTKAGVGLEQPEHRYGQHAEREFDLFQPDARHRSRRKRRPARRTTREARRSAPTTSRTTLSWRRPPHRATTRPSRVL